MSDQSTDATREPKSEKLPARLVVVTQYLKDLSFENPNAIAILTEQGEAPQGAVDVDVRARRLGAEIYEVSLKLRVRATCKETVAYLIEADYCGVFNVGTTPESRLESTLMVRAPRLLFPFLRAIIANAIYDGGYAPLMIQPIDFQALYRQRRRAVEQREAAMNGGGAPAA